MRRAPLCALLGLLLAGCTASHPAATPTTARTTAPPTASAPRPAPTETPTKTPTATPTGPIAAGPTTTTADSTCPFVGIDTVAGDVGMRLDRVIVLRAGGQPIGCRFYAVQGQPYDQSEHLPGPNQPAVQLTSARYRTATDAGNAVVRLAGPGGQRATGVTGACYQAAFDPTDGAKDWFCAFSVGTTMVTVATAIKDTSFDANAVATDVAGAFSR